jgi:D-aminoacyl-tRNA deacylase
MASALRALAEAGESIGFPATYESTHHGPAADHPSFFVEIGFGHGDDPPPEAVVALARLLPNLVEDPTDRIAVGIGGGHYVPHLTALALERRWAFGHLVSRHAYASAPRSVLEEALEKSAGAEGIVFARTADAEEAKVQGLGRRLRESEAPRRGSGGA